MDICTLGNRFYEEVLVVLPTAFVNENMASACEDFSEFSDEELANFSLNSDNIPFEENTSNDENADPNKQPLLKAHLS